MNHPLETSDDFAQEFNNGLLKICLALTTLTEFFISIPLFILFIFFDKYGEDSMKRSLFNCLNSQLAYPVITMITFYTPITTWRVFIGPLNAIAADFGSFYIKLSYKPYSNYHIRDKIKDS